MINRRKSYGGLLFAAVLLALLLTGCRAFEPEAVIVNKAPETYIIGAPLEHRGGYYHFHVFWYGSDEDGRVERFVWALTDTTLQDEDTVDDEEDQNFNPALDATTLEIANWTTRTDSIFNFTIDQGTDQAVDMTLHMVAIDDFGDYDRTPARLHFFSNTLGNPTISFFRIDGADTIPLAAGATDTVGFGKPMHIGWKGSTPNIRGYSPTALALVDTVAPFTDGLFGYKWRIEGALGGGCLPSLEDCWHPRRFNEATGDSFSYFGAVRSLYFANDNSGTGPFKELLTSGEVSMQVNSIDVAGVEVAEFERPFAFTVNYDPQTIILNGAQDWAHPEDPETYPYYIRLNDPTRTHHPFQAGDRIPDRTYVVVKALARDDLRDVRKDLDYKIGIAGNLVGIRSNFEGGTFRIFSESSALNESPPWFTAGCDTCWYADTLGFLTGPSTEFTINMQSVDEHGRRDGTPASLSFDVGYPPCLQCIELLPKTSLTSAYGPDLECVDDPATHPCFQSPTDFRITYTGLEPDALQYVQPAFIQVDKQTYFSSVAFTDDDVSGTKFVLPARIYRMSVLLHSKDDAREAWAEAVRRSGAFSYQVDYDCDPFNEIKDGPGDDIFQPSWAEDDNGEITVDPASGLWRLNVDIAVPERLLSAGVETFKLLLRIQEGNGDEAVAQAIFDSVTKQLSSGTIRALAIDQTLCDTSPRRPATYNFFRNVRPGGSLVGTQTWRDCTLTFPFMDRYRLSRGAMASHVPEDAPAVRFGLVVEPLQGPAFACDPNAVFTQR